jgi:hypothetical protein
MSTTGLVYVVSVFSSSGMFCHIYSHSRDFRFSSFDYGFVSGFTVKVSLRQTTDWEVGLAFLNSNRLRSLY